MRIGENTGSPGLRTGRGTRGGKARRPVLEPTKEKALEEGVLQTGAWAAQHQGHMEWSAAAVDRAHSWSLWWHLPTECPCALCCTAQHTHLVFKTNGNQPPFADFCSKCSNWSNSNKPDVTSGKMSHFHTSPPHHSLQSSPAHPQGLESQAA